MVTIHKKKVLKRKVKSRHRAKSRSVEKSAEIAYYYGFTHAVPFKLKKEDFDIARKVLELKEENELEKHIFSIRPEEKVALFRNFLKDNPSPLSQPLMLYYERIDGGRVRALPNEKRFYLDIIGTTKSIAEAVLIKTALEILKDEGYENLQIEINSIGDKDSMSSFMRDLSNYYRKNINTLSAHCRQALKDDPFDVLLCDNEKCQSQKGNAPHPIDSLSETARKHFGEVLEYLETLKIPYKISTDLLHSRKLCMGTIFSIKDTDTGTTLAVGLRYNSLSKKIGYKKELGAAGIFVHYKKGTGSVKKLKRKFKSAKIYFIQLGFEAKLKSLEIVEILRKEKIPLAQGLVKDKLAPQLEVAERLKVPYSIIMGQKEALEGSIIVRDMATRCQETIPIARLAEYLKKIKG